MFYESIEPVLKLQFSADQILSPYIYIFYAAFLIAFIFTPVMRMVALYYGIIDEPDRIRKIHAVPVAYLGGLAVFLGWVAGLAMSQLTNTHHRALYEPKHIYIPFPIVVSASIVVVLGLWDDIRGLKPWMKITGQTVAALMLLAAGIGTESTGGLLSPFFTRINMLSSAAVDAGPPSWQLYLTSITSAIFVIVVVVGCCNASNLMDGLDGLCGGVTAVIAGGFLFLTIHMAMYSGGENLNTDGLRVVLALALLGAVLGFVPYNFNPASIFMGDTGSMFLGFSIATLIIMMSELNPKWFLASTVMFSLPILDTALAFARRYVNRRPLFGADRNHFHHQLVARGFTVKQTVLISYGLTFFFVILGATIVFMRARYAAAIYLVVFGSIIVAAYKMGMVHEKPRVVTRRQLGASPLAPASMEKIEPGTVLEVRDDDTPTPPSVGVPGGFEQSS